MSSKKHLIERAWEYLQAFTAGLRKGAKTVTCGVVNSDMKVMASGLVLDVSPALWNWVQGWGQKGGTQNGHLSHHGPGSVSL